jgi:plasmid stabilization system protein ParE
MILLRPRALQDIVELSEADLEGLRGAFQLIERFPSIGSAYGRWRKWRYHHHRIYYRRDGQNVVIVRVLHERRLVPTRLR